ncbi:MAG TPA: L,D-transpeptidase family protein [Xanthobacteraceae bacterium]|nr:L,D-transpeptidase family protein [Xanthobacteraceae bacterium]
MKFPSSVVRALLASAAIAVATALAGCNSETITAISTERALRPLSPEMMRELEKKNMPKESPILVRLFKEESELEVWKQDTTGRFALLKTYPICRWSGELGPKVKEGDRQAPEGFYPITPGQMNPNSSYYLSINLGFPNEYDRAWGRTGDFLMIHGICSSRGCYAMTDEQIGEIYALARESFFGGQQSFQVQALPFRMTPLNMARHRTNPNMAFWKMLKEGYDHFEVTRLEPKVNVCDKRYVFDAEPPTPTRPNATPAPLRFSATGRCPAYQVNPEIAAAVAEKSQRDEIEIAELVHKGTPVAPIRTGADGGMHPVFQAALGQPRGIFDSDGNLRNIFDTKVPGTVPESTNPPRQVDPKTGVVPGTPASGGYGLASAGSKPVAAQPQAAGTPRVAESGNFFTRLFSSDGDKAASTGSVPQTAANEKKPASASHPAPKPQVATAKPAPGAEPKPAPTPQYAAAKPLPPASDGAPKPASDGAPPTAPSGNFESRWGTGQ